MEWMKPDRKTTKNVALIKKAFHAGFNEGVAFMNESDDGNANRWRREAYKKFIENNKIKE